MPIACAFKCEEWAQGVQAVWNIEGDACVVDLPKRKLCGNIPKQIGNLRYVTHLNLSHNALTGPIPLEIRRMTALVLLDLSNNRLSGVITHKISACVNLTFLSLRNNDLLGPIPVSMAGIETLLLDPPNVPADIEQILKDIRTENYHIGENLRWEQETIEMSYGCVDGLIPPSLGYLENLKDLHLDQNALYGPIPRELGQCNQMTGLDLSFNALEGTIPSSLGFLLNLRVLWLNNTNVEGTIPSALGDCVSLEWLNLSCNRLEGTIPATLGQCPHLEKIYLHANRLTGPIPIELTRCPLTVLNVEDNFLSGLCPLALKHVQTLCIDKANRFPVTPEEQAAAEQAQYDLEHPAEMPQPEIQFEY